MSKSIASLISIAQQGIPFTAADGQAFVRLNGPSGGFFILPIRSSEYRDWFFFRFFDQFDTIPSAHAFHAILNHLDAQANQSGVNQRLAVFRRVGSRGSTLFPDQILLDLANPERQFVEISPGNWRITADANALLQTSRSSAALPAPVPGPPDAPATPLQILRSCLNLSCHADWLRCLAWLLASLRPQGPFPFLILQGPPSSGKTFAARLLRCLIDPSVSPLSPTPTSVRDLITLARQNWILAFDHLPALSLPLTNALCRLSSGLGAAVRETVRAVPEPLLQYYKRPVILTVSDRWSCPPELAERALTLTFHPLSPDCRRTETALFIACNQAWPGILAALCSAVATALTRLPQMDLPVGRCADALAWAMAASPALGCTQEEMQQAFAPPPPPHPLVDAIRTLIAQHHHWTGKAAQLLDLLPPTLSCHTPKGLSHQLRSCAPILANSGIELKFKRLPGGARVIELHQDLCDAWSEKLPPHASQNCDPSPQPTET